MKFKTKIFITILSFLMTLSCSEESKLNEKYNCTGVDDCLSKYNFEDDKIKLRILANSLYPECEMGKQTGKKKNGRSYYNFNKNNDRKNELFKIHNLK